jgi:signal transduction histidine kinase
VCGDPVHLQQVLLNLVINGLDAARSGPERERFVSVSTKTRDDRMLEVTVSDSGPGVAPGKGSLIFEPFYTTKPAGMGIGLSICRTIIEAHGGRVWVDTEVGGGAAFRFTLPIQPGVPSS